MKNHIITKLLYAGLLLALGVRAYLILNYQINWDEFFYLSRIYSHQRGDSLFLFQNLHVYLFSWLTSIPGNEIEQIITARASMLIFQILTGLIIFKIARLYFNKNAALFSALSYFSFSHVITQGTSFRSDPIVTFFLMLSILLILINGKKGIRLTLAGILIGFSCMVTIKSFLYLPTIALILLFQNVKSSHKSKLAGIVLSAALIGGIFCFLLYFFHKNYFEIFSIEKFTSLISGSFYKTFNHQRLFPGMAYLRYTLKFDFVYWIVLLSGFLSVLFKIFTTDKKSRAPYFVFIAMILPLTTLIFYRNSYPYFYSFILAPASLLCAMTLSFLPWKRNPKLASLATALIVVVYMFNLVEMGLVRTTFLHLQDQKKMLKVIHTAFPKPVPYIDRNSMVASFPKKGFFMSTWGIDNYHQSGKNLLFNHIKKYQPKFLLANKNLLDVADPLYDKKFANTAGLFKKDIDALRNNYIPHWGKLYVAGKSFDATENRAVIKFHTYIEGIYSLESTKIAAIDGKDISPGESIYLDLGEHQISYQGRAQKIALRWGKDLFRPIETASKRSLYHGF